MAYSNSHRKRVEEVLKDLKEIGYKPMLTFNYDVIDLLNYTVKRRIISTRDEGFLADSVVTSKERDSIKRHLAHAIMNTDYKTAEDIKRYLKDLRNKHPKKYYSK